MKQPDGMASDSSQKVSLWAEKGFSRAEICARMQRADSDLNIFCAPTQLTPGATPLAYPELDSPHVVDDIRGLVADHDIDLLWPQASAVLDLSGIDAEVHAAGKPEIIALVDDKAAFSSWLGDDDIFAADAVEVIGVDAVAAEYERRREAGRQTCIKPVVGVYGQGYWRLSDEGGVDNLLDTPEKHVIDPRVYLAALAIKEAKTESSRLLMMDYLPGPEISVDMLCWKGDPLTHAVRTKLSSTRQRISAEHEAVSHAYSTAAKLALHGIINVQYRLDAEGQWKILEVNPRPAGGSINSEDAGFGIISNWARLLTNNIDPHQVEQHEAETHIDITRVPILSSVA